MALCVNLQCRPIAAAKHQEMGAGEMGFFKKAVFLLTLIATAQATALEGLFADPDFEGEGWSVESQNDKAFWTWFTYDDDGEPTFRVALAEVTITVDPLGNIIIDMAGTLFRVRNRNEDTVEGPFVARFQSIAGQLVGDVNAAGQRRSLVPFDYNFSNTIDKLHGYWSITTLDPALATGASVFALQFSEQQITLPDDTPAKEFQTFDGKPGMVFYDNGLALFVAAIDNGDNTIQVVSFEGNDQRSFGFTVTTDDSGRPISAIDLIYANALANTEQEAHAVDQLFPFFPFTAKGQTKRLLSTEMIENLRKIAGNMRKQ
jgi:hypothetical protein